MTGLKLSLHRPSREATGTIRTLMYHGLYEDGGLRCSMGDRRSYSVSKAAFASHMAAVGRVVDGAPEVTVAQIVGAAREGRWALTFDDGLSSMMAAADAVEEMGWRAWFFVVSGWIGRAGYATQADILDLHRRGHVIGSHSYSHPYPMAGLSLDAMLDEWRRSTYVLGCILGEPVMSASIPGGSLSADVVATARRAGVRVLFSSEPVSSLRLREGCLLVGRYAVRNGHSPETVAGLVQGRALPCVSQWVGWNTGNVAKRALGSGYPAVRARLMRSATAPRAHWALGKRYGPGASPPADE